MKFDWTQLISPVLGFLENLITKGKERKERRRLEKEAAERAEVEKDYIEGKLDVMPVEEKEVK